MRHRLGVASLAILTVVFAVGLFANQLAPYSYGHANVDALSSSPSWAHPFGTDQIGRDYFSSALLGLKTEVEIVLIVGLVGGLIGTAIGAAAGYLGGYTDSVVMRLADLLLTVPPLVTVLVAAAFLHTNTVRVYTSRDAGRTWTSSAGPSLGIDACAIGEPSAAVDSRGRQYVAFTASGTCQQAD